jgi:hypothetical protein
MGVYCWVLLAGAFSLAAQTSKPPCSVPIPGAAFTTGMLVIFVPPARYTLKVESTATAPPVTIPPVELLDPMKVEYSRLLVPLADGSILLKKNWFVGAKVFCKAPAVRGKSDELVMPSI